MWLLAGCRFWLGKNGCPVLRAFQLMIENCGHRWLGACRRTVLRATKVLVTVERSVRVEQGSRTDMDRH